jgi:hypothetical protein
VFKGKKIEKGIAFPTCVAANRWGGGEGVMGLHPRRRRRPLARAPPRLPAPRPCALTPRAAPRPARPPPPPRSVVGHFSPLAEDESVLKEGDLVKM